MRPYNYKNANTRKNMANKTRKNKIYKLKKIRGRHEAV